MYEKIIYINQVIHSFVWGPVMIAFMIFVGIYFSVRTRFFQIRKFPFVLKVTIGSLFKKEKKGSGITSFQAVSTALAGTLGIGSVVGVTTAILIGGPGAIFWMWVSSLFGMMSKFAEIVLAIHYRIKNEHGGYIGGAMTILEYGLKAPFLGVLFSLFCVFASFGIGNLTPSNTVSSSLEQFFHIPTLVVGVALALIIGIIIFGKAKRIMRFNEIMVPLMAMFYLLGCVFILFQHGSEIPAALSLIVTDAFEGLSITGGVSGFMLTRAIKYGISRGVFTNEAGLGSAPIAHASVEDVDIMKQGCWGIFEVFFDTMIVCSITALVILTSGLLDSGMNGVDMTIQCFLNAFGSFGGVFFCVAIVSFAISSIIGWYYYASVCLRYLFKGNMMIYIYQVIFLIFLILGSIMELNIVWEIADTLNGLMAIPNLISLVFLGGFVVKLATQKNRS